MRKRIATRAVALTLGSAGAALLYHAYRQGHHGEQDSMHEVEQPPFPTRDEVRAPETAEHPWADEVHALLRDQLWELREEARDAGREARPLHRPPA
jgi:hypothetical protein